MLVHDSSSSTQLLCLSVIVSFCGTQDFKTGPSHATRHMLILSMILSLSMTGVWSYHNSCWIRSHLELQDEDYVSSELEEADTVLIPAGSNGEDGAAGEGLEQPVRRSVRLDPDFDEITGTRLVQKRVIIREGKLSGQIGKVLQALGAASTNVTWCFAGSLVWSRLLLCARSRCSSQVAET